MAPHLASHLPLPRSEKRMEEDRHIHRPLLDGRHAILPRVLKRCLMMRAISFYCRAGGGRHPAGGSSSPHHPAIARVFLLAGIPCHVFLSGTRCLKGIFLILTNYSGMQFYKKKGPSKRDGVPHQKRGRKRISIFYRKTLEENSGS